MNSLTPRRTVHWRTASFGAVCPAHLCELGGALFGLRHVPLQELLSLDWVLGFTAAAISSFFVMRFMLDYLRSRSFAVFAYYRVAIGLAVIVLFLVRG